MKTLKAILILSAAIILTSCSQYSYTTYKEYSENTVRFINPAMAPMSITPTIADLDVANEKATYTASHPNNMSTVNSPYWINHNDEIIETIKANTLAQFAKQYEADVIVAPLFEIQTSENGETIDVTITGYPAKYINIRSFKAADTTLMKLYKIEVEQPNNISL